MPTNTIDMDFLKSYTEYVVQNVIKDITLKANLDNIIAQNNLPSNEETDMSRIKRRIIIDGTEYWVTADSERGLLQKAFELGTLNAASGVAPVKSATSGHNFREFASNWFDVYNKPSIETVSAITNERQLKKYLYPAFGAMDIEDITTDHIQQLFNSMGNLAKATKDKTKHVLNMILEHAVAKHIITVNPLSCRSLRITGKQSEKIPAYSVNDMKFFAQNIHRVKNPSDRAWLALMVYHPLRPEESLGLQYKNIITGDDGQRIMRIWATVTHPDRSKPLYKERLKTDSSRRVMAISEAALPYLGNGDSEDFVVGGKSPMSYTAVRHMCRRIAKDMGYSGTITPRKFRTTVASDLYAATHDVKLVQKSLGHAKFSQVAIDHYIELRQEIDTSGSIVANVYGGNVTQNVTRPAG